MNVPESAGQDIAATGRILTGGERFEGQQRVAISQNKQDSTMTSPEKRRTVRAKINKNIP